MITFIGVATTDDRRPVPKRVFSFRVFNYLGIRNNKTQEYSIKKTPEKKTTKTGRRAANIFYSRETIKINLSIN